MEGVTVFLDTLQLRCVTGRYLQYIRDRLHTPGKIEGLTLSVTPFSISAGGNCLGC